MRRSKNHPRNRRALSCSANAPATLESLESRLLLDVDPTFATPLADVYALPEVWGRAITLGIDGADADGDALTISVTSDDPRLIVTTSSGPRKFARLNFVDGSNNPIGSVVVELFEDRAPVAVQRFINLATKAIISGEWAAPDATHDPFYTDVDVHRVITNFMIQTGGTGGSHLDPDKPNGEEPRFDNEIDAHLSFFGPGVLATANAGPGTNDNQFFITTDPTHHLQGLHTIFGQVISGQEVVDEISRARGNNTNDPYDDIELASVDIITDNQQDATATAHAVRGFDGQATLTITLEDPTGKSVTRQVTVRRDPTWGDASQAADRPTIAAVPGVQHLVPGAAAKEARINVTDATDLAGELDVAVSTDVPGVSVSLIPSFGSHYILRYSLPAGYDGPDVIPVVITAREHALAGVGNLPPRAAVFHLTPWGERPEIAGVEQDEEVQIPAGQATLTRTITVTDDSDLDLNVTATRTSQQAGVNVTVADGVEPDTHVITITVPAEYRGGFQATITAQEQTGVSGITMGTTTRTFYITTLGDKPVIGEITDPLVLRSGQRHSFELVLSDDTNLDADANDLDMEVTVASEINGTGIDQQVVTVDSRTEAGSTRQIYTLHVDLTRRLPANYTGFFKVTVSAVEKEGTTVKDAPKAATREFYVFVQNDFDPPLTDAAATESDAKTAVVAGGRLYVGTSDGLEVFSLADPAHPALLGSYETDTQVRDIVVDGDVAYLAVYGSAYGSYVFTEGSLVAVDVSDPADIELLDSVETDSLVVDLALVGDRMFVAGWTGGLVVYDVTDPAAIAEVASFITDDRGRGLAQAVAVEINGDLAYVADAGAPAGRLVVLDISDIQNIAFLRQVYTSHASYTGRVLVMTPGQPSGLAMRDGRLYVGDNVNGLFVYDLERADQPRQIGWTRWKSSGIQVHGETAVLAYGGYHIFLNVADPQNMQQMYAMYTPGYTGTSALTDTHAYLPSEAEGVAVMEMADMYDGVMVDALQTFTAQDGSWVTVRVAGDGAARVHLTEQGHVERIIVGGTSASSRVILTGSVGASVDGVYIAGPVALLSMPRVSLTGDLEINGRPGQVILGDIGDGGAPAEQTIRFWANADDELLRPIVIRAGRIADVQFQSDYPIAYFSAVDWLDDEGDGSAANVDELAAPSISLLRINGRTGLPGNFQADLVLNEDDSAATATVLGTALIGGAVSSAQWDLAGRAATIIVSSAQDWDVNGTTGVSSLIIGQWMTGSLTAGWAGSLMTRPNIRTGATGDWGATVNITGNVARAYIMGDLTGQWTAGSIGTATVLGDVDGLTLMLTPDAVVAASTLALGRLDVRGWIRDSRILSRGRIGTVLTGGLDSSDIYAGYVGAADALTGLPSEAQMRDEALFSRFGSIADVLVRGIRGGAGYADSLIDSNIAAWTISSARLAWADLEPAGEPFGVAAHTLRLFSYHDADPAHRTLWTLGGATPPPAAIDNLVLRLV